MLIHLSGDWETRMVWLNGKRLDPRPSQKIWNHSPDGFNWGYGGSGPAQLALAVCLELYGKDLNTEQKKGREPLPFKHQDFKFKFISTLPQSNFDTQLDVPDPEFVKTNGWPTT